MFSSNGLLQMFAALRAAYYYNMNTDYLGRNRGTIQFFFLASPCIDNMYNTTAAALQQKHNNQALARAQLG